jgi:uncharacterized surface protein with fasciclin (FAS1) repeats
MKTIRIKPFVTLSIALFLATVPQLMGQAASKNVVDVAKDTIVRKEPLHATLVKLLESSGLAETLKSGGPYTLFAPTNDAFAALPKGKLEELQKPENKEELLKLLKHHVVPAKWAEADLAKQTEVTPMEGGPLAITAKGELVKKISGVATGDNPTEASNGIVYKVKGLLP